MTSQTGKQIITIHILHNISRNKKKTLKKSLWPLFMDGVQLPQG